AVRVIPRETARWPSSKPASRRSDWGRWTRPRRVLATTRSSSRYPRAGGSALRLTPLVDWADAQGASEAARGLAAADGVARIPLSLDRRRVLGREPLLPVHIRRDRSARIGQRGAAR